MTGAQVVLVHVLISVLSIKGGVAVKCYECFSRNDPNCADPFSTSSPQNMVECTPASANKLSDFLGSVNSELADYTKIDVPGSNIDVVLACQKVDISDTQTANNYTVRTCSLGKKNEADPCENIRTRISKSKTHKVQVTFCDVCDTDGCNGAGRLLTIITWASILGAMCLALAI